MIRHIATIGHVAKAKIILSISLFFCIYSSFSQGYTIKNYNIEDKLPSSEFYDVYKDINGFVWFSSDRGIVRYNSYEFECFSLESGLSSLVNFTFFKESDNTFWINGIDGTFTFWNGYKFVPFKFNENLKTSSKSNNNWNEIIKTDSQYIYYIKAKTIEPTVFKINRINGQISYENVKRITCSKNCSSKTKRAVNYLNTVFSKDLKQAPLILKNNYSYATGKVISINRKKELSIVHNEFITPDNELFLMTDDGLMIYDADNPTKNKFILENVSITSALITPFNEIWATSLTKGIYRIPSTNVINLDYFNGKNIDGLYSKGNLLFAKSILGEIYTINSSNEIESSFKQGNRGFYNGYESPLNSNDFYFGGSKYMNGSFQSPIEIKKNILPLTHQKFIEYDYSTFMVYTKKKEVIDTLTYQKKRVLSLKLDNDHLYIGTYDGIIHIKLNTKKENIISYSLHGVRINDIIKKNDVIWAGSLGKGLYYKIENDWFHFDHVELSSSSVHSIYAQNDSTLWVGNNNALNKITYEQNDNKIKSKKVEYYNTTNGLNSDYIKDIVFFNDHLYIATNNGICFLEPKKIEYPKPNLIINEVKVNNIVFDFNQTKNELSYDQNDLKISFNGVSDFKPINDYFYDYSLHKKGDNNKIKWEKTNNRELTYLNLNPGSYEFKVRCKNINNQLSKIKHLSFTIKPHFSSTLWFQGLIIFSSFLLAAIIWKKRTESLKNSLTLKLRAKSAELDTLRNQINPHFIFNSINAIQNYIFSNKKAEANLYINSLSKLIRKSLNLSRLKNISIEDEVQYLQDYLLLEKMRFNDKFDFNISYYGLKDTSVKIPSLMIQPLVENAVKHAFRKIDFTGTIDISFYIENNNDNISVDIIDNGVGFNLNKNPNIGSSKSLGIKIIMQRIELLNEMYPLKKSSLNINETNNKKGTRVCLTLPIIDK